MASFVREVLSATGTLGEKEDFPGKIIKLQKKLHDLKTSLMVHIDNKYSNFSSNLNDAANVTNQMEELNVEIETLNNDINNHLKTQLGETNKELIELENEIQELHLTLQVVNKIKICYEAIEDGNELVTEGKWLSASKRFSTGLEFVKNNSCDLVEENIKILPAVKLELIRLQQRLADTLCRQWKENVLISADGEGGGILQVKFVQGQDTENVLRELVEALHHTDLLQDQLVKLVSGLKTNFLEPIMTSECKTTFEPGKLQLKVLSKKTLETIQVFDLLRGLFTFLCTFLDVKLVGDSSLVGEMSPLLCPWLCDQLVRKVLAPAVPDTPDKLHTYQEIVDQTESLQEYLVTIGLVPKDNMTLLNYARNVDAIFASKLCQNLLVESREIMKRDLFITAEIGPDQVDDRDSESRQEIDDKLQLPPNFPLPESCFQFARCKVSRSAVELLELVERYLEDASQAVALCQVRLYHSVRSVFSLWCAVTPTYHSSALNSLPQTAALAHNSAFYLAHKLVTLGFLYKDKLPAVSSGPGFIPTFVDLVPSLREVGGEILLTSLRSQRDQLKQILNTDSFQALATNRRLSSGAEQAVKQVTHGLSHLHKVWAGVLPTNVYLKCIGTLLNTVMEELIQIVISLEDISAEAGEQLVSMLKQLLDKSPALFISEDPKRFVKKWAKFKELIFILGASLKDIDENWGRGGGQLSGEFPAEQVKLLVRALFQNTERRAAVLARIK